MKEKQIWSAPMAGFSDYAFRTICEYFGCDGSVTEMVSAKGLYYNDRHTPELMYNPDSKTTSLQIFGHEPEIMQEITKKYLNPLNFVSIDINMGCPMPKIVKNGDGSALMKNEKAAFEVVYAMKKVSNKPISVKIRAGFEKNDKNAPSFAKVLEDAGADWICVHGRTREQYYEGKADYDIIARVKQNLSIPVFGNGDVNSPEKARELLEYTNCDGIMIGRAVQGRPWLFTQIKSFLKNGTYEEDLSLTKRVEIIKKQFNLMLSHKPERIVVTEMRKHIGHYLSGIPNSAKMRNEINKIQDYKQLIEYLENLISNENKIMLSSIGL